MPKRIAIVGSGISGSLCARLLATRHDVTLFEAADRVGGHTHTVEVEAFGKSWSVDTGFMVFNDRTYPNFIRMLDLLGVESQPSEMSFSVHCSRTGLEYQGSSLNGLFTQRRNLFRPSFLRFLLGIKKFNDQVRQLLDAPEEGLTLGDWIARHNDVRESSICIEQDVIDKYLLPMTAAIWSAPPQAMMQFPMMFLAKFLDNHGLLQIYDRPQWRTISGGAQKYLDALLHPLSESVRISSPVTAIRRMKGLVEIEVCHKEKQVFDAVVLSAHGPQSLAMIEQPTELEKDILGAFQYQSNKVYLHFDEAMLPTRRRAWASWNYRLAEDESLPASVTYDLSRLQRVFTPTPLLQSLNPQETIEPSKVLQTLQFEHPLFDHRTHAAQRQHDRLHEGGSIYYCGAYWGYGFHEDGVVSALKVCEHFGINLEHLNQPC